MGDHFITTTAERLALTILADLLPHDTWGRATNPDWQGYGRAEIGVLNANVAGSLYRKGMLEYARCTCCGASLGVRITHAGADHSRGRDPS